MKTTLFTLFYIAFLLIMVRYGCCRGHSHGKNRGHDSGYAGKNVDPVCGMTVAAGDGYDRVYEGWEYRFCSKSCLEQFESNPERYIIRGRVAS
jgi:YHS domain-containing protein